MDQFKKLRDNFNYFDLKQFPGQKYIGGTGKHGITRSGQNKLFYADLMAFLAYVCEYKELPNHVVVAGGASGKHFVQLVNLFPQSTFWHLYDPCTREVFEKQLSSIQNVKLYVQYYDEEACKHWATQKKILFLSDIRNVGYTPAIEEVTRWYSQRQTVESRTRITELKKEMETMAMEDMKLQEEMVINTGADMSFVKFRPPYVSSDRDNYHFSYLKGKVFFQVQNRDNSTECRLMITPQNSQEEKFRDKTIAAEFKTVRYDALEHEEQCAFINNNLRPLWDCEGEKLLKSTYEGVYELFKKKGNRTIKEYLNMTTYADGNKQQNQQKTCRNGSNYVIPEEQYEESEHLGNHKFVIFKDRPVLSRQSQEAAWDFEMALEPGHWQIMFAISLDKSMEIWFGRTFNPDIYDLAHVPGAQDKPSAQPDDFEYKCIAKFPTCTEIRKMSADGGLQMENYVVSYFTGKNECSTLMPLAVNADFENFPWNNFTKQFSQKVLEKAIAWANKILSNGKSTKFTEGSKVMHTHSNPYLLMADDAELQRVTDSWRTKN